MKYIISGLVVLSLLGCGPKEELPKEPVSAPSPVPGPKGEQGEAGPKGDAGQKGEPAPTPTPDLSFEGYYLLPNGGYVDIYQDAQGYFTIRSARLILENKDTSLGLLPFSSANNLGAIDNVIYYTANLTYIPATHNSKRDADNVLLTGAKLTQIILTKTSEGKLRIRVLINETNYLAFDHFVLGQ